MLILTRKIGESIIINDDIQVKIVNVDYRYGCVRIGIQAPESIEIYREEIYDRVHKTLATYTKHEQF